MTSKQNNDTGSMSIIDTILNNDDGSNELLKEDELMIRLLGFCMKHMGINSSYLDLNKQSNFIELLDFYDIYHRKVKIPSFSSLNHDEFPLLVVFTKNFSYPQAIYRKGKKNWVYTPKNNSHNKLSDTEYSLYNTIAIEIYPSLPHIISNPFQLIKFVLQSQYLAIGAYLLASITLSLINLTIPIFTNVLVTRILPSSNYNLLFQSLLSVLIIFSSLIIFQYLRSQMSLRLETIADFRLQTAAWDRLMKLPMKDIWKYTVGDLAARVDSISQLRSLVGTSTIISTTEAIFGLSFIVLMFKYDSSLSFPSIILSIIIVLGIMVLARQMIKLQLPIQESAAELTNFSNQSILGLPQIRSSSAEPYLLLRWLGMINSYGKLQLKSNFYANVLEVLNSSLQSISTLLLFTIVTFQFLSSANASDIKTTVISYVAFNAAYMAFNASLISFTNQVASTLGNAAVLWKRASTVLYASLEEGFNPQASKIKILGNYTFNNISFKYPDTNNKLFNDFNLIIDANTHTAITGVSGCGKSTLVKLILGFISPDSGEVVVDSTPLQQLSIRTYRRQLGIVMQNMLLSGPIRNIISSGLNYSDEEIWNALEESAICDEIYELPMKLDTVISESGSSVSGGQMQRLAIARAIIRQPTVIILDEATSALDNKSQNKITDTLNKICTTRITIAHRLSTIVDADQIVLFRPNQQPIKGIITDSEISRYFNL